MKVNTIVMWK